ncbi:hypothetical protein DFP86_102272 [Paludibacterium purpuratum]|uniref:RsaL-like HTH domain-containing protein n=1 Tax=Paludibacterium purpuratum TaxID=1144873 RepID=A0A4R7BB84_9NEIS|nr:hypothetical protein DFP86_102272 [Paludibacterium purpuratum]
MKQTKLDPRVLRKQLGLNQTDFWGRIGITQSGGCRYESGRPMPKPVRAVLGVVYLGEKIEPYEDLREAA